MGFGDRSAVRGESIGGRYWGLEPSRIVGMLIIKGNSDLGTLIVVREVE